MKVTDKNFKKTSNDDTKKACIELYLYILSKKKYKNSYFCSYLES